MRGVQIAPPDLPPERLGLLTHPEPVSDEYEADEAEEHEVESPNREKMRPDPLKRRNKHSTSWRRLYISRSYSQGSTRVRSGGTTGM